MGRTSARLCVGSSTENRGAVWLEGLAISCGAILPSPSTRRPICGTGSNRVILSFMAASTDAALRKLMDAIVTGDIAAVGRLLGASPALASARLEQGATRQAATENRLRGNGHYVYAGDTALHVAAAAYQPVIART